GPRARWPRAPRCPLPPSARWGRARSRRPGRCRPWSGRSPGRAEPSSVLLHQGLAGELHPAALVHLEELDLHGVALLDHVFGLFGAPVLELRDVQQSFDARQYFDERAERGRALHGPFVNLPDFGGLNHSADDVTGALAALTHRGDGDQAGVVDVDLGAGLLLNRADGLPLGSDDVADLRLRDLDRDDPRRVLGQLRAGLRDGGFHDVE